MKWNKNGPCGMGEDESPSDYNLLCLRSDYILAQGGEALCNSIRSRGGVWAGPLHGQVHSLQSL